MFENLLYQNATNLIIDDIKNNKLPSSILLCGPQSSGKLTCALEIARVLSCENPDTKEKGSWICDCSSCRMHKELSSQNIVLTGPRDCSLEILASTKTLLEAGYNNSKHLVSSRFLFIRSVKKLLLRFSPILWEGDDKLSKITPLIEEINDELEKLNPQNPLPENDELKKITDEIIKKAEKLESTYMYDSLPIDHIRKASFWARLKSSEGKKVLIIENADRMNESSRNALLKILEEPPQDVVFILTTTKRGAVMPTILSRVRSYFFADRTPAQQSEVIERVFHASSTGTKDVIQSYLYGFLPIAPEGIREQAFKFYDGIKNNYLVQINEICHSCGEFEPRTLFKLFLQSLLDAQKNTVNSSFSQKTELEFKNIQAITDCYNNVCIYNQKCSSALENLYRNLAAIKKSI